MRPNLLILILSILIPGFSLASTSDVQGHLRMGQVSGTFTGAAEGDFSVVTSLELEGEYIYSGQTSLLARATVALDQEIEEFAYLHMGLGQRFYLWSRARAIESNAEGAFVSYNPKFRVFGEYTVGLAQVVVTKRTDVLVTQSTLIELGIGGGAIYQVSKNFGVSFTGMWSKGFAISSVNVDSTVIRGLLGVTLYF